MDAHYFLMYTFSTLELFARAGGGGSGGGGGEGGSIILLIGYFPSYYLGKLTKKYLSRRNELIVSTLSASMVTIMLMIGFAQLGRVGETVAFMIAAGVWTGWYMAFFGVWEKLLRRSKKTKNLLVAAKNNDPIWDEKILIDHAKSTFLQYQADWTSGDVDNIKTYTTPQYAQHAKLLITALQKLGRTNILSDVKILETSLLDINDQTLNSKDAYSVGFLASMHDKLIDTETNTVLFADRNEFVEVWHFARKGKRWLLSGIDQGTADRSSYQKSLDAFAISHNMFFSLDMGWLYLPKRGRLYNKVKFGVSDVNNHVIGYYESLFVQLYTINPDPKNEYSNSTIVTQIHLPKHYAGILIVPLDKYKGENQYLKDMSEIFGPILGATNPDKPKGYEKYTFEWEEFNKRYAVYATDSDKIATFELLNPGFMAYLYDIDPKAYLEVVDNVVYIFRTDLAVGKEDYIDYMNILKKAYKELKL